MDENELKALYALFLVLFAFVAFFSTVLIFVWVEKRDWKKRKKALFEELSHHKYEKKKLEEEKEELKKKHTNEKANQELSFGSELADIKEHHEKQISKLEYELRNPRMAAEKKQKKIETLKLTIEELEGKVRYKDSEREDLLKKVAWKESERSSLAQKLKRREAPFSPIKEQLETTRKELEEKKKTLQYKELRIKNEREGNEFLHQLLRVLKKQAVVERLKERKFSYFFSSLGEDCELWGWGWDGDTAIIEIPEDVDMFDPETCGFDDEEETYVESFNKGSFKIIPGVAKEIRRILREEEEKQAMTQKDVVTKEYTPQELTTMKEKGQSYRQISEVTGLKLGTVKGRLGKYRKKLREVEENSTKTEERNTKEPKS